MKNLTRALAALMLWCACASAASTVLISDTLKVAPENGLFYGTITITAPQMSRAGVPYVRWVRTYRVEAGAVSITLVPNAGSTPLNTRYKVDYAPDSNARPWSTWWVVPDSAISLKVQDVELPDTSAPAVIPLLNVSQINPSGATATYCIQYSGTAVTWGPCGSSVWGGLSGTLSNQTDLQVALNAKAAVAHTHIVGDVTGLQAALDGKSATTHTHATLYAALAHVHLVADVSGLQAALDGKSATTHNHTGTYEPIDATILRSGGAYANPAWLTALAWTKITGVDAIPTVINAAGVPTSVPAKAGDMYVDTDAGGLNYQAYCATTSGCWRAGGSGTATTTPNYSQSFTAQTSVTLTHNAGTNAILVQCYDGSGNVLEWNTLAKTNVNTATVTFSVAATGSCVVNASGGGGSGGTGDTTAAANSGAGAAVLKTGTNVTARTIVAGTNVTVTEGVDTITIASTGGSASYVSSTTVIVGTGANGCPLNQLCVNGQAIGMQISSTASLSFNSITAGQCGNATTVISVPGALNGDSVAAGWPATIASGWLGMMYVSAANEVSVRLCNLTGATATPTGGLTHKATIVRLF